MAQFQENACAVRGNDEIFTWEAQGNLSVNRPAVWAAGFFVKLRALSLRAEAFRRASFSLVVRSC
ncbi:MAG: hypothetical protein CVU57_25090 [Deltaproteobacteria bacterium HGW-Deltaproteobacteria-15]|nr:MAG: hypothetical protein CVU57_25090 [Deltaproteobacteria bacterium HGW-Deltaproteobacteria-15]